MPEQNNDLTAAEFEDVQTIVCNTINEIVACADKHNVDRDSLIKYVVSVFAATADLCTFQNYESEGAE